MAYDAQGADELVLLDITASHQGRGTIIDIVSQVAAVVSMGGKTPAKGVLAGRLRRSLGKAGFVGAQACAALYRAVQEGMPQTNTVVTVAGDGVWRAGNLRVPVGTPIGELLERCGVLPEILLFLF